MLQFICKKDDEVGLYIQVNHTNHLDKLFVRKFALDGFSNILSEEENAKSVEQVNSVFSLMSEAEQDYIFKLYDEINITLLQNYRQDEIKDTLNSIGNRILKDIERMKLVDYCNQHPFNKFPIQINSIKINFVSLILIIGIFLPVLIMVKSFNKRYVKNQTMNSLAVNRVLKPTIDTYFSKERMFIKNLIIDAIKNDYPEAKDIIIIDKKFKNICTFSEIILCNIISDIFTKAPCNNEVVFESINQFFIAYIRNYIRENK
jgi:hypothetical protein